jgi:hypothetical protein
LFSFYTWNFYHFKLYSSPFFLIFIFCNIFFYFFLYTFIIYTWNIYQFTLSVLFYNFLFIFFCFAKTLIQRLHKWCFNIEIVTLSHFNFYFIKNELKNLHVFINVYNFYYILLSVSINFLIHNYIFYSV